MPKTKRKAAPVGAPTDATGAKNVVPFTNFAASTSIHDEGENAVMRKAMAAPSSASNFLFKQPVLAHSLSTAAVAAASKDDELVGKDDFLKKGGKNSGVESILILPDDQAKKTKTSELIAEVESELRTGRKKKTNPRSSQKKRSANLLPQALPMKLLTSAKIATSVNP